MFDYNELPRNPYERMSYTPRPTQIQRPDDLPHDNEEVYPE